MASERYNFEKNIKNDIIPPLENSNMSRSINPSDSLKKWEDRNMYRTSYYSMSRYNVRINTFLI